MFCFIRFRQEYNYLLFGVEELIKELKENFKKFRIRFLNLMGIYLRYVVNNWSKVID